MATLPIQQTKNQDLQLLQNRWMPLINPVLKNTIVQGLQLKDIVLTASTPIVINHMLGRTQQGWFVTDINSNAQVWRTQPFNASTLTLEASADTTVNIWVY